MPAGLWLEAARPRTLPASIVPVIVGTASAQRLSPLRAALALVVALSLQIAVNFANDYFDAQKGVDRPDRVGPRRLTAAGLISPHAMRNAMIAMLFVAAAAGAALAFIVDMRLLAVGVVAVVAALTYSGGPKPYASAALGELFVFLFFGIVATVGSAYAQRSSIPSSAWPAAVSVGMLATAILVANNYRDIATDAVAGKRTLAVRIGDAQTRSFFRGMIVAPLLLLPLIAYLSASYWPLMAWLSVPFARAPLIAIGGATPTEHIKALVSAARLQLVFGALLGLGLWLA